MISPSNGSKLDPQGSMPRPFEVGCVGWRVAIKAPDVDVGGGCISVGEFVEVSTGAVDASGVWLASQAGVALASAVAVASGVGVAVRIR